MPLTEKEKDEITTKFTAMGMELLNAIREKDLIYYNLTKDLLGQIKLCTELEISFNIPTLVDTLEASIEAYRKSSELKLSPLQK